MALPVERHRFTTTDYHKMARAGILREDQRVELIEGEIVEMTPIGRRHLACVDRLTDLLVRGLGEQAIVRVQGSIRLHVYSEPQPDLVLLRRRPDFYATADAGPADVLLVIEVAETSLRYDRQIKVPLYARTGIPELWLVDLAGGTVTAYREPEGRDYRTVLTARGPDRLSPQAFPEFVLRADQILG